MSKKSLRRRVSAWTRPLRHALLLFFAETARRAIALLPMAWIVPAGRWAGRAAWLMAIGPRRLAERQLLESGVARDAADARRLGREVFESIGMNVIEWMHSTGWPDELFRQRVDIDPEPIRRLVAEGHGVIVVMGHIGNWEVQFRANRIYTGLEQNAVMAPQRSAVMNDWLIRQRTRGGDHMVSSQEGALPIVRLLRRGQIVGMLGDQDSARVRGIFVNFFGRPACTPAGIGLLCHLSGAPILPAAGYRMKDRPDHHVVTWGEPIRPDPNIDAETDMLRITQEYTKWLEDYIREHPEQWVWIHNRWKRKQKSEW